MDNSTISTFTPPLSSAFFQHQGSYTHFLFWWYHWYGSNGTDSPVLSSWNSENSCSVATVPWYRRYRCTVCEHWLLPPPPNTVLSRRLFRQRGPLCPNLRLCYGDEWVSLHHGRTFAGRRVWAHPGGRRLTSVTRKARGISKESR